MTAPRRPHLIDHREGFGQRRIDDPANMMGLMGVYPLRQNLFLHRRSR